MITLAACGVNTLVLSCLASNTLLKMLCRMCLVRSRERRVRWPLVICLREFCFHQSTCVTDESMVLMLPLTHGSGNVAKTQLSLSDIPSFWILKANVSCVFYQGIYNVVFSFVASSLLFFFF